jgi:hypothetical protein
VTTSEYLTLDLKEYYLKDFQRLTKLQTGTIWSLDKDLSKILLDINSSNDIQTLYSKRYTEKNSWTTDNESYLEISFSECIETTLEESLKLFQDKMGNFDIHVKIEKRLPIDNANFNKDSQFDIGCIKNPDYFRVNHFCIALNSFDINKHDIFWSELHNTLKNINR